MAKKTITVKNATKTEAIAEQIGKQLRGGETIELLSDIGGGKTTFTRGLARGAGSEDHVSSPTFTISNTYQTQKFDIYHFDFYRLHEAGIIEHQLHENVDVDRDVTVVEWSDIVAHVLPEERLRVFITSVGDEEREIRIEYPNKLSYLIDNVDTNS
jgi:tRNA threonylcarbamoyladenosine biosynthesis protein TsaE